MFQQLSLKSEPIEFLNANKLSEDGTSALQQYSFTEDGTLLAYIVCEKGSDWGNIKFKDVETNKDLDDELNHVKFSGISWTHDNKGIFYNQYPKSTKADGTTIEKNEFQQLFYHVIGTKQSDDILVAKFDNNGNWMGHGEVSDCGNYLVMSISQSCDPSNQVWYSDLRKINFKIEGLLDFVKLIDNFDAKYSYITNEGSKFIFKTNFKAPKNKIITVDIDNNHKKESFEWKNLIPEREDVLQGVSCVDNNKLVINYMHDCKVSNY
jgi:prolyl oligopeptidase